MKPSARSLITWSLSLTLLGLSACSTPTARERERERFEEINNLLKDEKEMGQKMAAKLIGTFGLVEDAKATEYLSLVGAVVASQSSRPEITYHFGILQSQEINAFATPGGYVLVTLALLKSVQSEHELAGVLGHEIAHVTEKHMYDTLRPKRSISAAETLTRMLSRGGSELGLSLTTMVNAGLEMLLEKGLGAEKESAADEVGTSFAFNAGYQPNALYHYLKRIQEHSQAGTLSKTHPPFPERLAKLEAYLEHNGFHLNQKSHSPETLQVRFQEALKNLPSGSSPPPSYETKSQP
ncbi:MAG: M48 family metalloprotease [Bdellovibrionia bacterium]